ncbi:MAG TPA: VWA domain-containing protein [Bryobacteraceae bacterium]|nr:VWA domain-containing protein [Bryobacteraceae bacterium]
MILSSALCTVLFAQQFPPIKVPVRLVAVPTLVFSEQGNLLTGLNASNFQLTDNGHPQHFQFDSNTPPVSLVLAVQASQSVRAYLPFVAKVGSTLDNSLLAESGESAVLSYDSDVETLKTFGQGDLESAIKKIKPGAETARMIDAGIAAVNLLKARPTNHAKLLVFIGQPYDSGSTTKFAALATTAQRENISVFAFVLPLYGKSFISDTFNIAGLPDAFYRGGYVASVELTKLGPALKRTAKIAAKSDPFALLTSQTGGIELHFRKQKDLENAIIALGGALHTTYTLTYSPNPLTSGYHSITVTTNVPGAVTHARSGYQLDLPQ